MHDRELYEKILGVTAPWSVDEVKLDIEAQEVVVRLSCSSAALVCPECGKTKPGYDSKERKWRHLGTMQMTTTLVASVPRVECEVHGVKQVRVPWAEGRSRFTALFEALVIDWFRVAPISAVAERLGLSWDQVDGIMQRAVLRGLARKEKRLPTAIGVDETNRSQSVGRHANVEGRPTRRQGTKPGKAHGPAWTGAGLKTCRA